MGSASHDRKANGLFKLIEKARMLTRPTASMTASSGWPVAAQARCTMGPPEKVVAVFMALNWA